MPPNPPTYSPLGTVLTYNGYMGAAYPLSVCSQCMSLVREIDQYGHTEWHVKVGDLPW